MAFIDRWFEKLEDRMLDDIKGNTPTVQREGLEKFFGYAPGEHEKEKELLNLTQTETCDVPLGQLWLVTTHNHVDRFFSRVVRMKDEDVLEAEAQRRMGRLRKLLIKHRR